LTADGEPCAAAFAAVCNIPFYGGRVALAPAARWNDRRLDLVRFTGRGRAALAAFALDLLRARHLRRPDVSFGRVGEVEISGPPGTTAQVDGDPCPEPPPLRIALSPERLPMLVPEAGR
jgi:diacylglycerol kinase family enzyme